MWIADGFQCPANAARSDSRNSTRNVRRTRATQCKTQTTQTVATFAQTQKKRSLSYNETSICICFASQTGSQYNMSNTAATAEVPAHPPALLQKRSARTDCTRLRGCVPKQQRNGGALPDTTGACNIWSACLWQIQVCLIPFRSTD